MKLLVKPIQTAYVIYAIILFIIFLLLIFPLVVVVSFFGRIKRGNILYRICGYWADAWLFLIGINTYKIYESNHDKSRQYIFTANHNSYMDVPMIVKVIRQPVRALGKSEISKIPVFGFLYRNAAVMVNRSSTENRAQSVMILKSIVKRGISIFIFPEGTFNTTGKPLNTFYDGAFRIAIETQTPIKPVIFPDTVKRLHYKSIWSLNPGKCRAVFLEQIDVSGLTIKEVPLLKQEVFRVMENALLKYSKA